MKFAKELERDLVPEWRAKYLNYRLGKKKLKAISRALRNVNQTPRTPRFRGPNPFLPSPLKAGPENSSLNRFNSRDGPLASPENERLRANFPAQTSRPRDITGAAPGEQDPLTTPRPGQQLRRYGSIIGTPPDDQPAFSSPITTRSRDAPSLSLPEPAMDPENRPIPANKGANGTSPSKYATPRLPPQPEEGNAYEVGATRSPPHKHSTLPSRHHSIFNPKRVNSTPGGADNPRPSHGRFFSFSGTPPGQTSVQTDVPMEAYRDFNIRQAEFFSFLDRELDKIEEFYKEKEEEATQRLKILREQLHIMRDRRLAELVSIQAAKLKQKSRKAAEDGLEHGPGVTPAADLASSSDSDENNAAKSRLLSIGNLVHPLDAAIEAAKGARGVQKKSKGMTELGTPTALRPQKMDDQRDYSRRHDLPDIPYRTAKRKLKVALQEYYRGLELLKSYALLNRTAFRKITKKYDKTVNARPSGRYMAEKVNKAWFVQSEVIEGHIRAVEDLYARYFEQGNHKVAVNKLRVKSVRGGDYTDSAFRNGVMAATGLVFGIQGVVKAIQNLYVSDVTLALNTSYLLQIYGGYFTMLLLMLLFCLDCRIWDNSKINYVFVFEFDTRHHLNWRQLYELPCLLLTLEGLIVWLNFNNFWHDSFFLYYPVLLIAISILILFLPVRALYFRTRQWFLYSNWRLLLAGLYPVEFRDFFLGDMFCSLTYAMGNIELFFCLYARHWNQPAMCNSSHSRLLGFFACLPGIWRALQCIRRYYDTKNIFPHLVNCGKYMATILYYLTLSLYRIDKTSETRALFIFFATVNAIYTSVWDVVMDWSLGDPYAQNRFLRPVLGYKKVWMYYVAMVLDPILRFQWIPYAIWTSDVQHSAVMSFVIAVVEVFRRGMWTIFRVENEHCTNVGRFRASRDVPLPYDLPSPISSSHPSPQDTFQRPSTPGQDENLARVPTALPPGTPGDLEAGRVRTHGSTRSATARTPRTPGELRRHASNYFGERVNRVGSILHAAHAQDFERRKKPEVGREEQDGTEGDSDSESDKDGGEGERGGTDEAERTLEDLIGEERRVRALVEQERASNDVEAGRGRENENGHGNGQARQDDGSRGAMGTMRRRRSSARS